MLLRSLWMRPALQTSEAVLLPALVKRQTMEPFFSDRFTHVVAGEDPFRPVPQSDSQPSLALSTYVRPRGSMAGRSVLRAAGVMGDPFARRGRPRYYSASQGRMPYGAGWRLGR